MKLGTIGANLGWLLIFLSFTLIFPLGISLYYHDGNWACFIEAAFTGLAIGGFLAYACVPEKDIGHREGFAIVGLGWVLAAFLGALPYYFSSAIPSFVDAYFESMSGFTTTGSTILDQVEPLGHGLLFWRALTHWLGGMGIIVLTLAILPILGIGGMQLFQAEMPGPTKDRLAPRIQDTARILWGVYLLFTLAEILLLMLAGMDLFNAVCHAFATLATGGFSTITASVGGFNSAWIDYIIVLFMILAGMNFTLHYRLLTGRGRDLLASSELKFYLTVGFGGSLLITFINLYHRTYDSFSESFRYSLFQAWSILTTTGFGTADFDKWAPACQFILVVFMFLGGMAGSTGGGIKNVRILLFLKFTKVHIKKLIHPRAVETLKIDGKKVPADVMQSILAYLSLYFAFLITAIFIVTAQGVDIVTGSTAVIATLNNIGPGLADVGPVKNFAHLPSLSKWVLILCMVAGRLELYTIAVLLVPDYWKGSRFPKWRWKKKNAIER